MSQTADKAKFRAVIDADTFRRVALCCGTDQTRYYLQGVFVEPHPDGGAKLTATNGHLMACVRDPSGHVEGAEIIRLSKDILRECSKHGRGEKKPRLVTISGNTAKLEKHAEGFDFPDEPTELTIAYQWHGVIIDGSFPDTNKVIPAAVANQFASSPALDVEKIALMGKALGSGRTEAVRLVAGADNLSPVLVLPLNRTVDGFGVIMPMRGDEIKGVPRWAIPAPAPEVVQEAAE